MVLNKHTNIIFTLFLLSGSCIVQADECPADISEGCHNSAPPEDQPSFNHSGSGGIITVGSGSNGSSGGGNGGSGGGSAGSSQPSKTPRQICLEDVDIKYATCRAQASGTYSTFLSSTCSGEGSVSVNGGTPVFNGTISIDEYNQCKDIAESRRNNAMDVCQVGKATQTASCP